MQGRMRGRMAALAVVSALVWGDLKLAFGLMVLAAVFDFFDGFAARLLNQSSPIGLQLDSLADDISFGLAPAAIMWRTSARVRTPPEAFTPMAGPTVRRMRATSSTVAPPRLKPVEVLTKSAPAGTANWQASTFSSSVSRAVSMMTLHNAPPACASATTAAICSATKS